MNSIFRSWVDAPPAGVQPSVRFVIRGWCYCRDGHSIQSIRARTSTRSFAGVYGDARPDVAREFADEPGSLRSGYEIPVKSHARDTLVQVEAKLSDQEWQPVQSIVLGGFRRIAWQEVAKWSLFWWRAWTGQPQAFKGLTESERDFVVARARLRGWVNLFVGPHHDPKALLPERFPAHRLSADWLPAITVVTPSLNQGAFLEATIRSVLNQRDVRIDYVINDGGSTDNTVDVIQQYSARLTHWESAPDRGQAEAICRGFARISQRETDVMMYLNADDVLLDGSARFVAEYFATHPDVDVVYGHRIFIDADGNEIGRWLTPRAQNHDLRMHDFVPQETMFWRRRIWDRVGGINPSLEFALDWDLLLRFAAAGARMVRLPWFLAAFRIHPQQKTNTKLEEHGIPEMDQLRQRTLGRAATHEELHRAMRQAELDSALVYGLWRCGWRL